MSRAARTARDARGRSRGATGKGGRGARKGLAVTVALLAGAVASGFQVVLVSQQLRDIRAAMRMLDPLC